MALLDLLRQEYVQGRVVDKYRTGNGNLGVVIEAGSRRYHVEFKDGYRGPSLENLFGLLKERFSGKTEHLDRLIREGDLVELTVSYSQGPLRQAYHIHSITSHRAYRGSNTILNLQYNSARGSPY